jgi:signal transduction histidine kinase
LADKIAVTIHASIQGLNMLAGQPGGAVADVLSLREGEHVCLLYNEDPAEQLPALLPYMQQGLQAGERVIYVADDIGPDRLRQSLREYGVDVDASEKQGALQIWTRREWRLPGPLDPIAKAQQVREAIDAAMRDGHTGARFAIEMTWTLGPAIEADELQRWEAMLNDVLAGGPVRMICQYSRRRLAPEVLRAGLLTHPVALLDGQVLANAFYEPLDGAAAPRSTSADVSRMVSQLQWVRRFEAERQKRLAAEQAARVTEIEFARMRRLYETANATADRLAKANEVKDEFLGLVSHELRTPLTVILGNAELMHNRRLGPDDQAVAADHIWSEAHRLNRLINNLLSVAQLGADGMSQLQPLSLWSTVDRVIGQHLGTFPEREIMVTRAGRERQCMGLEVLVEQVLANLLSNAEKYSPGPEPIEVRMSDEQGWSVISVLDRGIGLNPDEVNRAFEVFYRSDRASAVGPGLGLGLTVCKRLVEAQNGRIWARSRPEGGSEFCFMLRLAPDAAPRNEA